MALKASELINKLAQMAGIAPDSDLLKAIDTNADLSKFVVADEVANPILSNLYTVESAKENPTVKNHFWALAHKAIDSETAMKFKELGIDDATIEEINKAEKSTAKRQIQFAKKLAELESKKVSAIPDTEKHKKLTDEINALNEKIVNLNKANESTIAKLAGEKQDIIKDFKYNELFKTKEYSDSIPKELQSQVAKLAFENGLKKNNYKVAFEGDNLRLLTADDTKVFVNNKELTVDSFADSVFAENKLLKVSAPPVKTNGHDPKLQFTGGQSTTLDNSKFQADIAEAFKEAVQDHRN
jgi:hypothetical protein